MNYNKVILVGRLSRDPQLSYLPSQTAVVEIGLAMNRKFKKADDTQGEEVCFVDCQMFGKRAEVLNKYLHKGDPLMIEGRLKFDSWDGQDGSKKSKLRVMIESFEFMGGKKDDNYDAADVDDAMHQHAKGLGFSAQDAADDDIPF